MRHKRDLVTHKFNNHEFFWEKTICQCGSINCKWQWDAVNGIAICSIKLMSVIVESEYKEAKAWARSECRLCRSGDAIVSVTSGIRFRELWLWQVQCERDYLILTWLNKTRTFIVTLRDLICHVGTLCSSRKRKAFQLAKPYCRASGWLGVHGANELYRRFGLFDEQFTSFCEKSHTDYRSSWPSLWRKPCHDCRTGKTVAKR